jgi:hypothetical protein
MSYQSIVTLSAVTMSLSEYGHLISTVSMSLSEYCQIISSLHFHYHHSTIKLLYLYDHLFLHSELYIHYFLLIHVHPLHDLLTQVIPHSFFVLLPSCSLFSLFRPVVQLQYQKQTVDIGVGFLGILCGCHGNPPV